jgi:hypothetical protein
VKKSEIKYKEKSVTNANAGEVSRKAHLKKGSNIPTITELQ